MAIDDNTSYELTGYQVKDLAQKIRAKADASSLASVATSGLYSDLIGTPTIPTVYNGKLTIKQNGATIDEFTANQSSDTTISLTDTTYSDFTGATSSVAGAAGLVPAPAAGDDTKFLSGNGLWTTVSQYSLPIASSSTLGGIKVGNNLTIDPVTGVLDADGSTYTAGNGIDITNDEISIDTSVVAELSDIPTVNDSTITIEKNGTTVDSFTTNAAADKTINITVPTTAADVSALPASTKYGATFELSINSTTYVVTATLKDQDGNTLGTAQTIDLPLESVVVSGSYDSQTKEVVLTLQNGSTIRFSVADLVSGLQETLTPGNGINIDSNNEISIDDTVVAELSDLATVATTGSYSDLLDKPTIDNNLSTSSTNAVQNKIVTRFSEKLLCYGTTIAANSDLNTTPFLKIGRYYTSQSATAATFVNCPVTVAFHMDVEAPIDANYDNETTSSWVYRVRIITTLNGDKWFQEVHSNGTAGNFSYSSWKKYATSSDLAGKQDALTAGSNIQINNNTISATDTTYSPMTGATSSTAGTSGLVPAPAAGDQDKVLSGAGTWVAQSGGSSYTAGDHIDITNDVISAIDYISADSPTAAVSPSSPVTTPMIADGAVTSAKIATGVVPQITMTNVDPGEGTPLAENNFIAVYDTVGSLIDMFYPVGSYYETSNTSFNPNTAWGGTWVEDSAGKVTVAQDTNDTDFDTIGETGGEKTHTLTTNEMPNHSHSVANQDTTGFLVPSGNYYSLISSQASASTGQAGGDQPHNNVQPYVVVKRWHRTA